MRQKYWRIKTAQINTKNIHKYLQQQKLSKTHCKKSSNIGTCLKYLHMHEIMALAQKCRRTFKIYAANVCGKCMRQIYAANVGGKHRQQNIGGKCRRQMLAAKLCGIVKLLRHIIYDRNKADVEISTPIKKYAPKLCVQTLRLLTFWARQNLQLLTSSKSG